MKANELPSMEYLHSRLIYDPVSGNLFWKHNNKMSVQWNGRFANTKAGTLTSHKSGKSYEMLIVDYKKYKSHRVIFKMYYGFDPQEVDHINGDGLDNRIHNLRSVSPTENKRNLRLQKHNTSGVSGVCFNKTFNKWWAYIKLSGKQKSLGYFTKLEDAVAARKLAEIKYNFHPNHGSVRPL